MGWVYLMAPTSSNNSGEKLLTTGPSGLQDPRAGNRNYSDAHPSPKPPTQVLIVFLFFFSFALCTWQDSNRTELGEWEGHDVGSGERKPGPIPTPKPPAELPLPPLLFLLNQQIFPRHSSQILKCFPTPLLCLSLNVKAATLSLSSLNKKDQNLKFSLRALFN